MKVSTEKVKLYTPQHLAGTLDQSVLRPIHTAKDVEENAKLCLEHNFRALVIDPAYVSLAKRLLANSKVLCASVCDFPHGRETTDSRINSVRSLLNRGVDEVDIVAKYHLLLEGNIKEFKEDLKKVVQAMNEVPLKIILEVDYLTPEQIQEATSIICEIAKEENAKNLIVKTKTGFASKVNVQNVDAVNLIHKVLVDKGLYAEKIEEITKGKIGIKASGGVKTKQDVIPLLEVGAHVIGTSSGVEIVSN